MTIGQTEKDLLFACIYLHKDHATLCLILCKQLAEIRAYRDPHMSPIYQRNAISKYLYRAWTESHFRRKPK
jgi:hypothetical protein